MSVIFSPLILILVVIALVCILARSRRWARWGLVAVLVATVTLAGLTVVAYQQGPCADAPRAVTLAEGQGDEEFPVSCDACVAALPCWYCQMFFMGMCNCEDEGQE